MRVKLLKAAESLHGRLAAAAQWLEWPVPRGGPLVWVHAASVGEALTTLPILDRLRAARTRIGSVLTFTSPSVERWPSSLGANRSGYLPRNDPETMNAMFQYLRPAVLVFARGDLWPGLVAAARRHRVPVLLVGATVRPTGTRLRPAVRLALRRTYSAVRWAGAVSPGDAERLIRLGVSAAAVHITGDPRHDQIIERPVSLRVARSILTWAGGDPVMVAGSTHPEDHRVLLPAFRHVLGRFPDARLVVVPHGTHPIEIERLAEAAAAWGFTHAVLGLDPPANVRLLLGRGIGTLADLYLGATCAYVGGGLSRAGLHAVAEPASFGIPVLFGRRDNGDLTADQRALLDSGGGVAVSWRGAATAIAERWRRWLVDPDVARHAGMAARGALTSGAARVSTGAILECL